MNPEDPLDLKAISTRWTAVNNPALFALRYALPVRAYLLALTRDPHDADEITQEFLTAATRTGFPHASPERGKFRHYLITAVRNAARAYYGRRQARPGPVPLPDHLAAPDDDRWLVEWRRGLLDRAWQALDRHERASPGNLAYTALRLVTDDPDASSEELAARVAERTGQPMRADAFRKQLSRARRLFAELLAEEVALTLDRPTPDGVEEELGELGFLDYVRPFLAE